MAMSEKAKNRLINYGMIAAAVGLFVLVTQLVDRGYITPDQAAEVEGHINDELDETLNKDDDEEGTDAAGR